MIVHSRLLFCPMITSTFAVFSNPIAVVFVFPLTSTPISRFLEECAENALSVVQMQAQSSMNWAALFANRFWYAFHSLQCTFWIWCHLCFFSAFIHSSIITIHLSHDFSIDCPSLVLTLVCYVLITANNYLYTFFFLFNVIFQWCYCSHVPLLVLVFQCRPDSRNNKQGVYYALSFRISCLLHWMSGVLSYFYYFSSAVLMFNLWTCSNKEERCWIFAFLRKLSIAQHVLYIITLRLT